MPGIKTTILFLFSDTKKMRRSFAIFFVSDVKITHCISSKNITVDAIVVRDTAEKKCLSLHYWFFIVPFFFRYAIYICDKYAV